MRSAGRITRVWLCASFSMAMFSYGASHAEPATGCAFDHYEVGHIVVAQIDTPNGASADDPKCFNWTPQASLSSFYDTWENNSGANPVSGNHYTEKANFSLTGENTFQKKDKLFFSIDSGLTQVTIKSGEDRIRVTTQLDTDVTTAYEFPWPGETNDSIAQTGRFESAITVPTGTARFTDRELAGAPNPDIVSEPFRGRGLVVSTSFTYNLKRSEKRTFGTADDALVTTDSDISSMALVASHRYLGSYDKTKDIDGDTVAAGHKLKVGWTMSYRIHSDFADDKKTVLYQISSKFGGAYGRSMRINRENANSFTAIGSVAAKRASAGTFKSNLSLTGEYEIQFNDAEPDRLAGSDAEEDLTLFREDLSHALNIRLDLGVDPMTNSVEMADMRSRFSLAANGTIAQPSRPNDPTFFSTTTFYEVDASYERVIIHNDSWLTRLTGKIGGAYRNLLTKSGSDGSTRFTGFAVYAELKAKF